MRRRRLLMTGAMLLAGAVVVPTGVAAGSSSNGIPPGPIMLAADVSLTGSEAAYGVATEAGLKAGLAAWDKANPNGIDGHQIKITFGNDGSATSTGVDVANQFVANKDTAVITVSYDPVIVADQMAVFAKAHLPVLADVPSAPYNDVRKFPLVFSPDVSDAADGLAAAHWITKHHYTRIAILNDGYPTDLEFARDITGPLKRIDAKATVVRTTSITPGSVDDTAAITTLKGSNPQLVIVAVAAGYGPVWDAMAAVNWSPHILTEAGAWYDGFSAMGSLASKAVAPFQACANGPNQSFSSTQRTLMTMYNSITYGYEVNYLTYMLGDTVPFDILKYAINKYHSTAPLKIAKAIEGIHGLRFDGFTYNFSRTDHYGLTGTYGAAVCQMAPPYAGGPGKVPIKA